jgi:hypothetical protein
MLAAIAAGMFGRLILAWFSIGTNDAITWRMEAMGIVERGLFDAYERYHDLNHPPLSPLWWAGALRVSQATGASFEFVIKLPAILADASTCILLWRICSPLVSLLFACSPVAILVSGYHCNTDSIYAFLCLLSAYFASQRKMTLSGVALAAGINIKLVPILLIPPLLASCRDRKDLARFAAGLSLGVVPFIPVLIFAGDAFARDVLSYTPQFNRWGLPFLLYEMHQRGFHADFALSMMKVYYFNGRYTILAAVVVLSVVAWRSARWSPYELCAVSLAIFLILTPGFGVQYTVSVLPLLLVVSTWWGGLYSLVAGAFLLVVYWINWTGTFPMFSFFDGPFPMPAALVGVLAWGVLVAFVAWMLTGKRLSAA